MSRWVVDVATALWNDRRLKISLWGGVGLLCGWYLPCHLVQRGSNLYEVRFLLRKYRKAKIIRLNSGAVFKFIRSLFSKQLRIFVATVIPESAPLCLRERESEIFRIEGLDMYDQLTIDQIIELIEVIDLKEEIRIFSVLHSNPADCSCI